MKFRAVLILAIIASTVRVTAQNTGNPDPDNLIGQDSNYYSSSIPRDFSRRTSCGFRRCRCGNFGGCKRCLLERGEACVH